MLFLSFFLALLGIGTCLYLVHVEQQLAHDRTYKAACDLSDTVSCTRPLLSNYSTLFFGTSNAKMGIVFYAVVAICALLELPILFVITLLGVSVTVAGAYLLYGKLHSFCILCTLTYIINILLFIDALKIV
ncbi:MAG: vitamin K epoxide reductase family protein [Candidatus Babeliales bacterium]